MYFCRHTFEWACELWIAVKCQYCFWHCEMCEMMEFRLSVVGVFGSYYMWLCVSFAFLPLCFPMCMCSCNHIQMLAQFLFLFHLILQTKPFPSVSYCIWEKQFWAHSSHKIQWYLLYVVCFVVYVRKFGSASTKT